MTRKEPIILNEGSGQQITFLTPDNVPGSLEMEAVYPPSSSEPALHYHPGQEEIFTVISGTLQVRIERRIISLRAGDSLKIQKGQVHSMWNNDIVPATVNWKVAPALRTEEFLRAYTSICNAAKRNKRSGPKFSDTALMAAEYSREIRLAKPPYPVQWLLFALIGIGSKISGYFR